MGGRLAQVSDICLIQGGLQATKKHASNPIEKLYLCMANVMRKEVKTMRMTPSEFGMVILKENDMLVVEGGGNKEDIGRCAMWDGSVRDEIYQNHLIRIVVNSEEISSRFVNEYIN